jgi:hypothetical protein
MTMAMAISMTMRIVMTMTMRIAMKRQSQKEWFMDT